MLLSSLSIPLYKKLPKKYFEYDDVPRPLVSLTWLQNFERSLKVCKDVNAKCTSSDEDAPLVTLVTKHKSKRTKRGCRAKTVRQCKKRKEKIKIVARKRGRPRKLLEENTSEIHNNEDSWDKSDISDTWLEDVSYEPFVNFYEVENNNGVDEATAVDSGDKNTNKKQDKKEKQYVGVLKDGKMCYPCNECGKDFSAVSTLKYHIRIHNGNLLQCDKCDKGFTTKYLLKCHQRVHTGELFMCHTCGRGFTTAEVLKVHVRTHTGDKPFACDVCGKSFPAASGLQQHKFVHNQERKYLCSECGSAFTQKRALESHMVSHKSKSFTCTICGKLWARKQDLTQHMRVHTGVRPYSCKVCNQCFTQASSLRRHQLTHTNCKPILCILCSKVFKTDEYFKRHTKKHAKEAGCEGKMLEITDE